MAGLMDSWKTKCGSRPLGIGRLQHRDAMKLDRAKENNMNRLGWGVGELEGRQWERHLLHLGWVVLVKVGELVLCIYSTCLTNLCSYKWPTLDARNTSIGPVEQSPQWAQIIWDWSMVRYLSLCKFTLLTFVRHPSHLGKRLKLIKFAEFEHFCT